MKKQLKRVNTQRDLSMLIFNLSKDNYFGQTAEETGVLSVNDASSVAKVVSDTIQKQGYGDYFMDNIIDAINYSKCKPGKKPLAIEIVCLIFRDVDRWFFFSQSRKMMKRVIANDKTPVK